MAGLSQDSGYDELMREVEDAVMGRETNSRSRRSPMIQTHMDDNNSPQPLFSTGLGSEERSESDYVHTNGHLNAPQQADFGLHSEGSDAEAEAGLAALQMADEQDALDEARRQSGADSHTSSHHTRDSSRPGVTSTEGTSSDSDVPVDINSYGGGFSGHVHYGDQSFSHPSNQGSYAEQDYGRRPAVTGHEVSNNDLETYQACMIIQCPKTRSSINSLLRLALVSTLAVPGVSLSPVLEGLALKMGTRQH